MNSNQAFHTRTEAEVAASLEVTPARGLSQEEASLRAVQFGENAIEEAVRTTFLEKFLRQFSDVMIVVLLIAAVLAGALGEFHDTLVILIIVVLNAVFGSVQEYRAERALDALRKMTSPGANVRRNGHIQHIPADQLVPGDIVFLEAGDIVPGDLRLFETVDFEVEEAALTGESLPVTKQISIIDNPDVPLGDRLNMAYKGTRVTRGHAMGITVATGALTELGRIATLLRGSKDILTPLQNRLARFGKRLAIAVLIIAAIIFTSGLLRGEELFLMILTAVSIAVAAIPEALPAVVAISLALGARKMGRHNALMRRLSAVETLGSVTYICSDKTGTLTLNEMRLAVIYADGREINSLSETGDSHELWQWLTRALALCTNVNRDFKHQITGDPTEIALYLGALDVECDKFELEKSLPRLAELPFHADRRTMTTLNQVGDSVVAFSKGAPEAVLSLCKHQLTSRGETELNKEALLKQSSDLAEQGYRVLAIAMRKFPGLPTDLSVDAVESGLTLLGLVGLIDPPRPEVAQAIQDCRSAGITPVMITGDHPGTARAIAQQLGISTDAGVLTGAGLDQLSEEDFLQKSRDIHVYARVSPTQKIRIVTALQKQGEYVAMTGDGVNDAPALKQANIGIAMGQKGTDVAREASDMVLTDDNFATIVSAIREGRRIFDNIRKFIKYTMTSNTGEIWTLFLAPFLGLPLPLIPIQILWINLVTDGLPGLALSVEPQESGIMKRPPRPPDESIFVHGMWQHIAGTGLLIAALSLGAQAWAWHGGSQNWQTMVFTVLTFSQLAHVFVIRSEHESIFSIGFMGNLPLLGTVILTIGLHLFVIYHPFFNFIFRTTPLTMDELFICFTLPLVVLFAVEVEKWLIRKGWIYGLKTAEST
jgi:Ca2+-transporting ATPase